MYKKANVHFSHQVSFEKKSVLKTYADMITASWSDREKSKIELDELVAKYEGSEANETRKKIRKISK